MRNVLLPLALVAHTYASKYSSRDDKSAIPFSPGFDIEQVVNLAQSKPSHSWEFGTAAEALLELYNPELSVFGATPFPVQKSSQDSVSALSYASKTITIGGVNGTLADGTDAIGDPASLGVSAVMLGKSDAKFADAAGKQLAYILNSAPRYSNGAISQRAEQKQLWADFMYMAPPFLAYYAADAQNGTLLSDTVEQCRLYHDILVSDGANKNWQHIIGEDPSGDDTGLWATGNGWAAGGMARVLATVLKAPVAQTASWRGKAVSDLTSMIKEILDGAMAQPNDAGLLRNYLDDTTSRHGFGEISGSSMLASVAYRMAVLQPDVFGASYVTWADGIRKVIGEKNHVTTNGVATPAVNPLNWKDTTPFTSGSPEGQAFVVLMYAAWRDCVLAKKCTADGGSAKRMLIRRSRPMHTSNSVAV